MLSTSQGASDGRHVTARAQRPNKAKRARLPMASENEMPASPTQTKKARKVGLQLPTIDDVLTEPTSPKKARARQFVDAIPKRSARSSPSPIATDQADSTESPTCGLPDLVAALREISRRRQDAVLAEGNLTRQMKRIVSRVLGRPKVTTAEVNDLAMSHAIAPLMAAREAPKAWRAQEEKAMVKLVEQLPVYGAFWEPIHGLGALGLALIVGEAGDLSLYSNPAKLWKRFGLHVIQGRACATWRSKGGFSAKDWEEAGYSPRRRSMIFTITDSLLKKQNVYKALCDERKAYEKATAESAGLIVAPAADVPKGQHDKYRSLGHIKARAERYVAKRLLRDLWRAWRDHVTIVTQATAVSPCSQSPE